MQHLVAIVLIGRAYLELRGDFGAPASMAEIAVLLLELRLPGDSLKLWR